MLNNLDLQKQNLIEKIQYVYETDVGDFKRKATLYLNRFIDQQKEIKLRQKVQNLRNTILYTESSSKNEMENVESLRLFLIEELKKM